MAENLQKAGIGVSVIEMQNQVMAPLDYELAELLHENMTMNGVELILGDGVVSFVARDDGSWPEAGQSGQRWYCSPLG